MSASSPLPSNLDALLNEAVARLRGGELVAFPTETVYGLGADALNPQALACLYQVKGRPPSHPVIVHLAAAAQLDDWAVDIPEPARALVAAFWPGPLTLILNRADQVPDAVTGGQDTVGLRVPNHPVALALLERFGGGLAAPSANRFGRLSPTSAAHVRADLGADAGMILDGGDCPVGVESTIVAFQAGQPVILRPGMITTDQIRVVTGQGANVARQETAIRVPGSLSSHYAPRTPMALLPAEALLGRVQAHLGEGRSVGIGVLAFGAPPSGWIESPRQRWLQAAPEPTDYAQKLYGRLRLLDAAGLEMILVEAVPGGPEWAAIVDRLSRAAYPA